MAIIDYKCSSCGKEFFEIVNSDTQKVKCPSCGGEELKRVYKGKFYGKSGSCGGDCSCCGGCH